MRDDLASNPYSDAPSSQRSSSRGRERKGPVSRPIIVEPIFAKGDIGGPLALEDFVALMLVSLIYVALALVIVTSESRKKHAQSARGKNVSA